MSDDCVPSHQLYGRRIKAASKEQQRMIIDFMITHGDLSPAKYTLRQRKTEAHKQWSQLARRLNGVQGGTTRDWRKWVKYWADVKHKVKVKALKCSGSETSAAYSLTDSEKRLLAFLSKQPDGGGGDDAGPDSGVFSRLHNDNVSDDEENTDSDLHNDDTEKSTPAPETEEVLFKRSKDLSVKTEPREEQRDSTRSPELKPDVPVRKFVKSTSGTNDKVFQKFLGWETMKLDYDKERLSIDRLREKNRREKNIQEFELRKQEVEIRKNELEIKKHELVMQKKRLDLECMREENEKKRIEVFESIERRRIELDERRIDVDRIREENERSRLELEAKRME